MKCSNACILLKCAASTCVGITGVGIAGVGIVGVGITGVGIAVCTSSVKLCCTSNAEFKRRRDNVPFLSRSAMLECDIAISGVSVRYLVLTQN